MTRRLPIVVGLAALVTVGGQARQDLTVGEAQSMGRKLDAVLARGLQVPPVVRASRTTQHTSFTEREVNAYLKFYGELPAGVVDPQIFISEQGRLRARATVDLDAVRKSQPRGWTDPLSYVSGALEIRAAGTLKTTEGTGVFTLESATLAGVPIPKTLLQEIVSYYTRTPELPAGFNLDRPFELPHQIRSIETQRGAATIVQ